MIGEKAFSMGVFLAVSIVVARHLGAADYGILAYAFSLGTLFAMATHMGLHGLAVRELVRYPEQHHELLGTIFSLKLLAGVVAFMMFGIITFATEETGTPSFYALVLISGIILLKPFEVFDFWFQARVMAKYASISRVLGGMVFAIASFWLIYQNASVQAFAATYLLQAFAIALFFIVFFMAKSRRSLPIFSFSKKKAVALISESWMILFAALFAIIYLKIDQVMLRWMVDSREVGLYSVAVQLSEAWYFIPTMIAASLFPKLIELKDSHPDRYQKRLQQLLDMLFIMALVIALVMTIFSKTLILFLYGEEFEKSALFLSIHIWAALFIFMRAAFSKWILVEGAIAFSMITQGLGALCNVLLNLLLIPVFEGTGAALTTVFSYVVASYLALLVHHKTRPIFRMMTLSLAAPIRLFLPEKKNKP